MVGSPPSGLASGPRQPADGADDELVAEIAAGNQEALADAYRRHSSRVYALAWRILGDRPAAEGVLEAVFVRLWDHPEAFDGRCGSLGCHLLMEARARSVELVPTTSAGRPARSRVGGEALAAAAASDVLEAEERQVIELGFFEGCTTTEIAERLEVDEQLVFGWIRSGLQRLARTSPRAGPT